MVYYSQAQDWNNPGGAKAGYKDGDGWDDAQKGSFDTYIDQVAVPQVREILTRYHPDVLWWDTPHLMTQPRAEKLAKLLSLSPGIIHNNRLGGGYKGDTETPDRIPATGFPGRDWETCMTMNDTWGYKSYDQNWKSAETLIRNLVDIASKGGNYLLNVGPKGEGAIPAGKHRASAGDRRMDEGQRRVDLRHRRPARSRSSPGAAAREAPPATTPSSISTSSTGPRMANSRSPASPTP